MVNLPRIVAGFSERLLRSFISRDREASAVVCAWIRSRATKHHPNGFGSLQTRLRASQQRRLNQKLATIKCRIDGDVKLRTLSVPNYKKFIEPMLRHLARLDAPAQPYEVAQAVAEVLALTDVERQEQVGTGKAVYRDRAGWAFSWLKILGLAELPEDGGWLLTPKGRELANAHPLIPPDVFARLDAMVERGGESRKGTPLRAAANQLNLSMPGNRKAYRLPPEPLARGGQADVYVAVRKADNKTLILKRARRSWGENRMRREIEVQSKLNHVNVMPIFDWDREDYLWYVMPKGTRVMSQLHRPLADDAICVIAKNVVGALVAGDAVGNPHRDVKPQNVIALDDEQGTRWVLADWGLTRRPPGETTAKPTKTGQFLGSEGFAPPEAYSDAHNVGVLGDIYALGQLIAWATGVDPVPTVSPEVAAPWDKLVTALTQQKREDRPQTILEVQRMLAQLCERVGCA
jgi:hypothetical protein